MMWIYGLCIRFYYATIWLYGLFNQKAKRWILSQKKREYPNLENSVWVHCASLGEYNQARPLIDHLESEGHEIVITFYSPSGYDKIILERPCYYLPLDTRVNAKRFINKINPKLAIFIRSEYWFNHMKVLDQKNIPLVIMNCFLSNDHYFFKWFGKWAFNQIKEITLFLTINESTRDLLNKAGISQVTTTGDTKVDHVVSVTRQKDLIKVDPTKKVILIASAEPNDINVVSKIIDERKAHNQIIIVPHELSEESFQLYNNISNQSLKKYSELDGEFEELIYIDQFGLLASLYDQAWISYIGGGFDQGIHNILESCVAETPMIIGPKHKKFPEAKRLIDLQSVIEINNQDQVIDAIKYFDDIDNYKNAVTACKKYIASNEGATMKVLEILKSKNLL